MRSYERFPFVLSRSDQVGLCQMDFYFASVAGAHFAFVGPYPGSIPGCGILQKEFTDGRFTPTA